MVVKELFNSFHPCPKPLQKTQQKKQKSAEMKKKSKKLAKLERQRDKGLIKSGICEYCGNFSKRLDPHEVFRRK